MPTENQAPQLLLDNQLCFAIHATGRAIVRAYGSLLEPLGLTYPQYLVMLTLWEDTDAASSVGAIGRRLQLDTGTLTPLLKRMERSGLIERQRDTADERRVLIRLTEDGRALRERAADVPSTMGAMFGIDLGAGQRLKSDLESLLTNLDAAS